MKNLRLVGRSMLLSLLLLSGHAVAQQSAPDWFVNLPELSWQPIPGAVSLADSAVAVPKKRATFEAWNGATIDQNAGEMIFAANGGHQDSGENYVVGFHFKSATPAWRLLSAASANDDRTECAPNGRYADGTASSTHSYGAHAYIPLTGEVALAGMGSTYCGNGAGSRSLWLWDRDGNADTRGWEYIGPWGSNSSAITAAAWDPSSRKLWWTPQFADTSMISFDPITREITNYTQNDTARSGMLGTAATAGQRGLYVSIWGKSSVRMWVYKTTDPVNNFWRVREGEIQGYPSTGKAAPAIMWHAASDAFLVYPGSGTTVYVALPDDWNSPSNWSFVPLQANAGGVQPDETYSQGLFHKVDIIEDMGNGQSALVLIPRETSVPLIYKLPVKGVTGIVRPGRIVDLVAE